MFKKILVAVDGSPFSQYAIPDAIALATCFKSEIVVLHVHEREVGRAGAFPLETLEEAGHLVAGSVQIIRKAGIPVTGEVQRATTGHVAKQIVDTAKADDCDLIVMGSRGLSDMAGLMLGSVTHKVLQLAHVPVFVARGEMTEATGELVGAGQQSATS
jgi:nucleotide-binding universal stress UspA family protein